MFVPFDSRSSFGASMHFFFILVSGISYWCQNGKIVERGKAAGSNELRSLIAPFGHLVRIRTTPHGGSSLPSTVDSYEMFWRPWSETWQSSRPRCCQSSLDWHAIKQKKATAMSRLVGLTRSGPEHVADFTRLAGWFTAWFRVKLRLACPLVVDQHRVPAGCRPCWSLVHQHWVPIFCIVTEGQVFWVPLQGWSMEAKI